MLPIVISTLMMEKNQKSTKFNQTKEKIMIIVMRIEIFFLFLNEVFIIGVFNNLFHFIEVLIIGKFFKRPTNEKLNWQAGILMKYRANVSQIEIRMKNQTNGNQKENIDVMKVVRVPKVSNLSIKSNSILMKHKIPCWNCIIGILINNNSKLTQEFLIQGFCFHYLLKLSPIVAFVTHTQGFIILSAFIIYSKFHW